MKVATKSIEGVGRRIRCQATEFTNIRVEQSILESGR